MIKYFKRYLLLSLLVIITSTGVYLFVDYRGPQKITLKNDIAFGFSCLRARDLVVQEYDKDGNLWATRGMKIYHLKKGDDKFTRVAHVPTGFSIFWLRNFSIVRKLTIRPECVEMVSTSSGDLCALSAGKIWLLRRGEKEFKETFSLPHYGFGDPGIRNDGILNINDSIIYFGEYFQNPERDQIKIFTSKNGIQSWDVKYSFQPGQIRHIHAIQKDPYTERLWICTGDSDEESMVAWSDDEFNTIQKIGQGNQIWRVCQLVFTEDAVFWGTDTGSEDYGGIYRWDKKSAELEKLYGIDGAVFFGTRLKNGTIVMSTNREGMENEKDDRTRLYIISKENEIASLECGTWNHKKPGFWYKYAMLRFQRDQGGASLAITCLNQKEFPDSELIIISEKTLLSAVKTSNSIDLLSE
jgi:hypothetical protein